MKTIFVMQDSLVRAALGSYGGTKIPTPNFDRLAARGISFDRHYVGSLPCMPARRELHTGRLNFFHRSWGPLEPFDLSAPELMQQHNVYSHLVTDHYHYFEDGGSTYHNRYNSYDFIRGQEWDKWKARVEPPVEDYKANYHPLQFSESRADGRLQHLINRDSIRDESDFCTPRTYQAAFEFLDSNREADNWFLQLELFDPHEPFAAPERFKSMFPTDYEGPILNWPRYKKVEETPGEIAELRANYAALVAMCDEYFGRLLDYMDTHDMWKDTAIVLSTDHGILLSEHEWWQKNRMPFYNEIAHIPLIIYHPDHASRAGERRSALTQTVDLMPTFLEWHGVPVPQGLDAKSLNPVLENDAPQREVAVFGMFGSSTNVTDGRYTYFNYPEDMLAVDLYEYTLMPMRQKKLFSAAEFDGAELTRAFEYTNGYPVLKLPALKNAAGQPCGHASQGPYADTDSRLFDLETDPGQETPIDAPDVVARLVAGMVDVMRANEAPAEAFERLCVQQQ
uniref:sulfatase n=1 Tax=Pararhizobium sp. IMCC3301 TaxID=3067904 RepID=UPI002741FF05|nr:sulfatase [Pararhizobium sp. IMCC3301]